MTSSIEAVYYMAWTSVTPDQEGLAKMMRYGAEFLAKENRSFKDIYQAAVDGGAAFHGSFQAYQAQGHSPQRMEAEFIGWIRDQGIQSFLIPKQNFFIRGMKDTQHQDTFIFFFFKEAGE